MRNVFAVVLGGLAFGFMVEGFDAVTGKRSFGVGHALVRTIIFVALSQGIVWWKRRQKESD